MNVVILTGAGISAESGIKTFRGSDGLWEDHAIEDVASIDGYRRNPTLVQEFYNQRRRSLLQSEIKPNAAHAALKELEDVWSGDFLLVTQNVDDLHDRAGSKKLLHMHGELLKVRCEHSERIFPWMVDVDEQSKCSCCERTKTLRPHIVWFGEMPFEMPRICESLEKADLFVSIGTSGQVYPAAGFVRLVPPASRKIEVNMEGTAISDAFDEHRTGPASIEIPKLVKELLLGFCFITTVLFALVGAGSLASADEPGIPAAAEDPMCTDVAFYDFHNSLISVKDGQALASQPNDQDALPFKNGVCELRDDPMSDKPDWHYELLGDFVMRPTHQAKVRVIRIFENHLSGSGSWDRLMAFMCRSGKLEKIWQKRFVSGLVVKRVNEIQFKISKFGQKPKQTPKHKSKSSAKEKNTDVGLYQWDNKHLTFFKR